jgi:hypothetical protein
MDFPERRDQFSVQTLFYFIYIQVSDIHGQEFLVAKTTHPAIGLVDFQQAASCVHHPEAIHGCLNDYPLPFLAIAQCLFGLLALRDIQGEPDRTGTLPSSS